MTEQIALLIIVGLIAIAVLFFISWFNKQGDIVGIKCFFTTAKTTTKESKVRTSKIEEGQKKRELWERRMRRHLYLPVLCYFMVFFMTFGTYLYKDASDNIYFYGGLMAFNIAVLCYSLYWAGRAKEICLS